MPPRPPRILLAEDNPLSLQLLSSALAGAGFEVIKCADGLEALQRAQSEKPSLLVMDYDMPQLTGAEVCAHVRKNSDKVLASMPIILMSAHCPEDFEALALAAGADEFLSKPLDLTALIGRIKSQLRPKAAAKASVAS